MQPVLGYWKIRGLAQPIRLLLEYRSIDFVDKYYEVGDAPDYSREVWFREKYSLGLDFPNLPYYIDGDIRLSQSNTILRYLARKYNLDGTTEAEKIRVDLAADELMDLRNNLVNLCYNKHFESLLPQYVKDVDDKLKLFDNFLGDRDWLAGETITSVDFVMYELLDQHRIMIPDCLKECSKLQRFIERFEALPVMKVYMHSDKFMKRPLNNKMASFK
ncbi:hypothetical protein LSH36_659g02031 [Paralvinella palmiformis]|uniref:glutathione transferase n=1 Tax=Paralvinella palmiformis TaxID=53620 RepID=A0AAD9J397_9ANNE|nr:hypothetical protein LSH36_659g02031 [Paralvinella palmiformis]